MAFDRNKFDDLYPFESHWLTLAAGVRLHYLDVGPRAAPAILFVHGNPTWSFHWRRLVTRLSGDFRCIAIDHLGCGLSDKPPRDFVLADHIANLRQLIGALGLHRYSLVAQDWGGAIGLGLITERPANVDRIVLFNTAAFPPPYIPWQIAACRIPLVGQIAVQGGNLFARAALRMTLATRKLDPRVAAAYVAPYDSWANRRQIRAFVDDIPTHPEQPTWQQLAAIEASLPQLADRPAMLVWGMKDWCFRPECLDRLVALWPQADVHRFEHAGHWVVEDVPDDVDHLMQAFFACATAQVVE